MLSQRYGQLQDCLHKTVSLLSRVESAVLAKVSSVYLFIAAAIADLTTIR